MESTIKSVSEQTAGQSEINQELRSLAHKEPLVEFHEKASPNHTALVVIDVQNDFCAEGGMMHAEGLDLSAVQGMIETLSHVIHTARAAGVLCVFVKNIYSTESNWYLSDSWLEQAQRRRAGSYIGRKVCELDAWNGQFFGPIHPQSRDPVITKHRYCAFTNTDLDLVLRSHGIRTVVLTGVATNVCVETTARSAFVRDYYVVIPSDCVATYSDAEQEVSLRVLDRYFGEVVVSSDLENVWAQ